jgi:outer membrane protein assembly factor BamB
MEAFFFGVLNNLWSESRTLFSKLIHSRAIWMGVGVVIVVGAIILGVTLTRQRSVSMYRAGQVSVLTASYDMMRTGQNRQEMTLTTANVNKDHFGLLTSFPVVGDVQAQPLYVPNVTIRGKPQNVVYIATTADHVYALDADNRGSSAEPLWDDDLGISNQAPGIYGTPVISLDQHGGGTLYIVTNDSPQAEHLHALDITNGKPRPGSPMLIAPEGFRPATTYERTGLALVNGVIYGGWRADEFSKFVEHGWVMAFDAGTLKLISAFNTTPDGDTLVHGPNLGNGLSLGNPGSVWQSTTGLSVDADGNVYPVVGNGPFTGDTGGHSYGDSFLKLRLIDGKLSLVDYFTPFDQQCLVAWDHDLGSSGNLLLPDQAGPHPHLMISVSKGGRLYVVDRDHLGKYVSVSGIDCTLPPKQNAHVDQVVQESQDGLLPGLFMAPVYWQTPDGKQFVYLSGADADTGRGDRIKAFELTNGQLNLTPAMQTALTYGYPGAGIVVSSNGKKAGTGILWALQPGHCSAGRCEPQSPGILHAYDATNLSRELYTSDQNPERDGMDSYQRFTRPVVADGKVFVCSQSTLSIYGLL